LPYDPDEAVVQTVRAAIALLGSFNRCAERARPQFRWRCLKAEKELRAMLQRYFEPDEE
jgi:hypothetical protein